MIRPIGLYVRIVFIQPQVEKSSPGFVAPAGLWIIIPCLSGARLKGDAIQRYAPPPPSAPHGSLLRLRLHRYPKLIALRRQRIRISPPRKGTRGMIRPPICFDHSIVTLHRDAHFIVHRCRSCSLSDLRLLLVTGMGQRSAGADRESRKYERRDRGREME